LSITLVEGELSPRSLRERVSDLVAVLPNAQVVTLPGQDHEAHLLAPAQLAAAIRTVAGQLLG
jgi:pimeloyl-ACP methyl ester carboxylesterase